MCGILFCSFFSLCRTLIYMQTACQNKNDKQDSLFLVILSCLCNHVVSLSDRIAVFWSLFHVFFKSINNVDARFKVSV